MNMTRTDPSPEEITAQIKQWLKQTEEVVMFQQLIDYLAELEE
jgi:hypothetical protein